MSVSWRDGLIGSLLGLSLGLAAPSAGATLTFGAGIEQSQWYLSASIFECALTHNIPRYGRGVFYHEAGEELLFYLDANRNLMRPGQAALVLEAPLWRPGERIRDLGHVPVAETSGRVLTVNQARAEQMIDSLMQGMMPTFTRRAQHNDEAIRVEISAVNFADLYEDYTACIASLLPVNFRQVERTAVFFRVDEAVLTDADRRALDRVILYVKADPAVTAIFVDGHTDASGRRIYNRRLSKDRADAVNAYLVQHGLSENMVTVRYHGERYPVADNRSSQGKARNRRTTVRLEKGTRPPGEEELFEFRDEESGRVLSRQDPFANLP